MICDDVIYGDMICDDVIYGDMIYGDMICDDVIYGDMICDDVICDDEYETYYINDIILYQAYNTVRHIIILYITIY